MGRTESLSVDSLGFASFRPPLLEKMFPTHGSDKKEIIIANYSLFPII
jgi:hypothetical protein